MERCLRYLIFICDKKTIIIQIKSQSNMIVYYFIQPKLCQKTIDTIKIRKLKMVSFDN